METNRLFTGNGNVQRNNYLDLPVVDPAQLNSPENYIASEGLAAAVETALTLGMPLLLTGEPGCGKSQLAFRIAWELGFPDGNPIRFPVKSTTEARDLFYTFDTVGRFHAAQSSKFEPDKVAPENFITYQALGLAILRAKGKSGRAAITSAGSILNPDQNVHLGDEPQRSVVLLDEIDKAPRDVPNDILYEIESLEFNVPELELTDSIGLSDQDNEYRPVIVITSNSERDLPDAFLRRCVYHHVEFPPFKLRESDEISVEKIVHSRFGDRFSEKSRFVGHALELIKELRDDAIALNKPPSIAEILNWLDLFDKSRERDGNSINENLGLDQLEREFLFDSVRNTLLKTSEDQLRATELVENWLDNSKTS